MNQKQNFDRLKAFLNDHIYGDVSNGKVTVFPVRCGIGKSTFVKHIIANAIRSKDHGLIIVTDSLTRMDEYIDDEYLKRNMDSIAMLKNQTLSTEIIRQRRKPILIMSTQRFFALTKEEIIQFTKYDGGRRTKIIIDEKALFYIQRQIGIAELDNIDAALYEAIDDLADADEKEWITQQWAKLIKRVKAIIKEYEDATINQIETWHTFDPNCVTEDDERFFAFVKKYKGKLTEYRGDTYPNLCAVRQMFQKGATFIGTKVISGEYKNYFTVVQDNSDLVLDLGADVYVLDGTADIDPEYNTYFVNMVDCSQFDVPLDNLTICFVDIPTSKNNIIKSGSHSKAIIESIKNYLKTSPDRFDAVFTYAAIENQFKEDGVKVGHFGNLKGYNTYRECVNIAQIGWNRYPDSTYRQMDYVTSLAEYDYRNKTIVRLTGRNTYISTMNRALLADFEQNLFRSKIRNIDCDETVHYTVFCNIKAYKELIDMIRDRYGKLGATITELPTPCDYEINKSLERNTSTKSNVQTVLDWYRRQPSGKIVKASEIYEACNLTREQFKTAKKSPAVKRILKSMKTDVSGIYKIPD